MTQKAVVDTGECTGLMRISAVGGESTAVTFTVPPLMMEVL